MNKFSVQKSAQFLNLNPQQFRNLFKKGKLGVEPVGFYKTKYGKKAPLFGMEQLIELDSCEEVKKARARKKISKPKVDEIDDKSNHLRRIKVTVHKNGEYRGLGELTTREIWEKWGISDISHDCIELTVVG